MTTLTEFFTTNNIDKLKYELAQLVESKDYKIVNKLLSRNTNALLIPR